jgi:hypothetical protein
LKADGAAPESENAAKNADEVQLWNISVEQGRLGFVTSDRSVTDTLSKFIKDMYALDRPQTTYIQKRSDLKFARRELIQKHLFLFL